MKPGRSKKKTGESKVELVNDGENSGEISLGKNLWIVGEFFGQTIYPSGNFKREKPG